MSTFKQSVLEILKKLIVFKFFNLINYYDANVLPFENISMLWALNYVKKIAKTLN